MDSKDDSVNLRSLRRGRVLDRLGRPIANALVAVVSGNAPAPEIGRRTTEEGVFQIALPQGRHRVEAIAPTGAIGIAEVEDGAGGEIVITIEQ